MENKCDLSIYADELRLFSYRMSGSLSYADNLAEDILCDSFSAPPLGESGERAALYRKAAQLCSAYLQGRVPRSLPSMDGAGFGSAGHPGPPAAEKGELFLEPYPDALLPASVSNTSRFEARESVSFEFVGALQKLEPWARVLLLLSDVLGFDREEAGFIMENGLPGGWDSLEAVRFSFSDSYCRSTGLREPPPENEAGPLLMRYIHYWEAADKAGLEAMLSDDVVFQSPPSGRWLRGRREVMEHIASGLLNDGLCGAWRLLPMRANGQLAFGVYRRPGPMHTFSADSIHVVYFSGLSICELTAFRCPSLFPLFGLLPELIPQGE